MSFKRKIIRQPDPALDHLITVLNVISQIFNNMESSLTKYLSLWFDLSESRWFNEGHSLLVDIEGRKIKAEMEQVAGRRRPAASV